MTTGTLRQHFAVVDTVWAIATDSPEILACAAASFPHGMVDEHLPVDFTLKISVDDRLSGSVDATPVFRGRDHLVFAQYGRAGFFALDLRRRTGLGVVSRELARDTAYWRESIFPVVLGLMCLVLDAVPLHSACIECQGRGVLIAGRSGMGKSTLAATFARMGFRYLSDDWLYLSGRTGRVHACPVNMKLMPEAIAQFFPELDALPQSVAMNGEVSVSFDPAAAFKAPRSFSCQPETVILLERNPGAEIRLRGASADDLVAFFSEPLDCVPPRLAARRERQLELIRTLSRNQCFVLACGGTPVEIAAAVLDICNENIEPGPAAPRLIPDVVPLDLLRRYAATPHRRKCSAGDVVVDFSSDFLHPLLGLKEVSPASNNDIAVDLLAETRPGAPLRAPVFFGDANLIGCSFGGNGCFLLDRSARSGMAFVHPRLLETGAFAESLTRVLEKGGMTAPTCTPDADQAAAVKMGAAL